jgi:hypothetical protein
MIKEALVTVALAFGQTPTVIDPITGNAGDGTRRSCSEFVLAASRS